MALPVTHRWIVLGNIIVRNPKRAAPNAPKTSFKEVIDVAKSLLEKQKHYREFGNNKSRLMCFSNIEERDDYYWLLAEIGDKNVAGFSFLDFQTRETRDVNKRKNEGSHYTAHLAISKSPHSNDTGHLLLAEKVPGVHLGSIKDHLTWLCKDERLQKLYKDQNGKGRNVTGVFEVDGYQSGTIHDALNTGTLQDIEFIEILERYDDGLDEDSVVRQVVHEAKWDVKKKVNEDEAKEVFKSMRNFFHSKFRQNQDSDARMFVRIKTTAGQIRRTQVDEHRENILEQAFVQNEYVGDFDTPLTQRHDRLRDDMISKISGIAKQLGERNEDDV